MGIKPPLIGVEKFSSLPLVLAEFHRSKTFHHETTMRQVSTEKPVNGYVIQAWNWQ